MIFATVSASAQTLDYDIGKCLKKHGATAIMQFVDEGKSRSTILSTNI